MFKVYLSPICVFASETSENYKCPLIHCLRQRVVSAEGLRSKPFAHTRANEPPPPKPWQRGGRLEGQGQAEHEHTHTQKRGGHTMAIFHVSFKILNRCKDGKSKSSLYLAAYNSRQRLEDKKTGMVFNYEKKKEDLLFEYIILPENAPSRFYDRSTLWNSVEEKEKRADSQLARTLIIALPRELGLIKNKNLLSDYLKKNFVKKGMCADIAIHNDPENNNPHAHIMLTMRDVNETGFLNKNRTWNDKKNIDIWRRSWAVSVNKALRENDKMERITHLSHLRQKELIIQKAKEKIEKNELAEAEKLINLYDDFKNKKPRKRKPRHHYLNRKKARMTYAEEINIINKMEEKKKKQKKKI